MQFQYKTKGTCSQAIIFDLDPETHIVSGCSFIGGCNGNTQGVSILVDGQKAETVIDKLSGVRCGMRPTSCPDQLATALKQALDQL